MHTTSTSCRLALCLGFTALLCSCEAGEVSSPGNDGSDGGVGPAPAWTQPTPAAQETCNGFDDNLDGQVDEGCPCRAGAQQSCFVGLPSQLQGACKQGVQICAGATEFAAWSACTGAIGPAQETCGNGIDEDCDGADLACSQAPPPPPDAGAAPACQAGQQQPCYSGPAGTQGVGLCRSGIATCTAAGAWGPCLGEVLPQKEVCGNAIDESCDGKDPQCPNVPVPILIFGDCVTVSCPPSTPFPVGCLINFSGGDHRGCVASTPTNSVVYLQEGDRCSAGSVTGILHCSKTPGPPLNPLTCPINKKTRYYPPDRWGCPATN